MNNISSIIKSNILVLPLLVLTLGTLGRGIENSLMFLYFLTGLIFLISSIFRETSNKLDLSAKVIIFIWLSLYAEWLFTTLLQDANNKGQKQWLVSFLASFVILYSIKFRTEISLAKILSSRLLHFSIILALLVYAVRLTNCLLSTNCEPTSSVSLISFAIYFPLIAIVLYYYFGQLWWKWFIAISPLIFILLILGDSRTELVMFLITMLSIVTFYYRKLIWVLLSPLALILVIFIFSYLVQSGDAVYQDDFKTFIYKVSTNRMAIWEHAITNPPDNILLGSGINNSNAFLPEYKHSDAFHNAFLEIWYETGYLGLALWLILFTILLKDLFKVYLSKDNDFRFLYMIFLSCFVAVIIAGLLDKGYMSMHFRWRVYVFGALLFVIGQQITAKKIIENPSNNEFR